MSTLANRRKSQVWTLIGIMILFIAGTVVLAEGNWKKEKSTRDGITVYSRTQPGTTVREVRARLTIDAAPQTVLEAACDPETFKETTGKYVKQNKMYKGETENIWFNYQLVDFPVVAQRDYCLRYQKIMDAENGIFRLKWSVSNRYIPPPLNDVVRVSTVNGVIDIKPVDDGRRSVMRYTLLADPGGNIPTWIINLANRTSLPNILREIRDASLRRAKSAQ